MLCTFCGTENRPEYKFCGICGVRLDRRQMERRSANGISTKCTACGHVSETGLKFCGMCGTRVERRIQDRRNNADEPRAAAIANAQLPTPDIKGRVTTPVATRTESLEDDLTVAPPRKGEPAIFRSETQRNETQRRNELQRDETQGNEPRRNDMGNGRSISGPSFLGLNSQPEDGVEYLLEDEPTGGGLRKLLLLVILAAIIGLVFVQWRSSLKANPKPAPAKTDPATVPSPIPQGSNQPQGSTTTDPTPADTRASSVGVDSSAANSPSGESKDKKVDTSAADSAAATSTTPPEAEDPADKKTVPEQVPPASDIKPAEEAKLPDYKPTAALLRAQQYIRGHGVPQNCEQGLLYLRAATDKNDPGAAIQMAALYSSGLCVKQDRVMAYRWFNSAHELQPANMWIQKNMDQLWAQMSSQERRLAGY